MIIQCINCKKKFEVDYSLIPDEGRNIQCGSCSHIWLYTTKQDIIAPVLSEIKNNNEDKSTKTNEKQVGLEDQIKEDFIFEKELHKFKDNNIEKSTKNKVSTGFSIGKILSYIVVVIISFIALIIILDTFKSSLNIIFPSLELMLYNLFESIKDVLLFLKNLLE